MSDFESRMERLEDAIATISARTLLILPQNHLHAIPKPKNLQSKYGRDPNMAAMFRELVAFENEKLPLGAPRRFLTFPEHLTDDEINEDAKRAIFGLLCLYIDEEDGVRAWELRTWTELFNSDKKRGKFILRQAEQQPELRVFAQGGGQWALRMLADQRQKATKRTAQMRSTRAKKEIQNKKRKIETHKDPIPTPPPEIDGEP